MQAINQPSLFDLPARDLKPQKPIKKRYAEMSRTESESDAEWKRAYENFILAYAETHSEFSAEDVRFAFLADASQPQTHTQQASGGIFLRLAREGKLKKVGFKRSQKFGNILQSYSKG